LELRPERDVFPAESLEDAADRAYRLQRVSERLVEAMTAQQVLDAVLTEGLRAAEARAGAIGALSEDAHSIELLAQRGYKETVLTDYGRFPVSADLPMSHVARTGKPLFISSMAERNTLSRLSWARARTATRSRSCRSSSKAGSSACSGSRSARTWRPARAGGR